MCGQGCWEVFVLYDGVKQHLYHLSYLDWKKKDAPCLMKMLFAYTLHPQIYNICRSWSCHEVWDRTAGCIHHI